MEELVEKNENQSLVFKALDWAYEKSIGDVPGLGSAVSLGNDYLNKPGSLSEQVDSLINWQISKAATSGFLTGLPGLTMMPITIPANIGSVLYMQLKMIGAIAHMSGHDVKSDQVKTAMYLCLTGNAATGVVKNIGINIGERLTLNLIKSVPGKSLTKINQAVGLRLITKFGTTGAINMGKAVPLLGGIIGGTVDAITTKGVAKIAKNIFLLDTEDNFVVPIETVDNVNLDFLRFQSIVNLIKVDGKVAEEEVSMLETILESSLLDEDKKMEVISSIHSSNAVKVDYSLFKDDFDTCLSLIKSLIDVARRDGEFNVTEKMYIKNVGKQIGFSEQDINELISSQV